MTVYDGDMPNVLTTVEASQRYGLSSGYLRYLMGRGLLKGRRSGVIWLIDEASLKRFLKTERKPGPKPGTATKAA